MCWESGVIGVLRLRGPHVDAGRFAQDDDWTGDCDGSALKPVRFNAASGRLPDAAVFGWGHGLAFLAAEGRAEAGLVDDGSVGAEVVGRVGVGLDLGADDLGA